MHTANTASLAHLFTAFLRQADGTIASFHVPDEGGAPLPTRADDINDAGVIVGNFLPGAHDHEDGAEHDHESEEGTALPFLRMQDGSIFRVSLPNIAQAHFADINNGGVISGFSIGANSLRQGLVLIPMATGPNLFIRDTPAGGDDHDQDH